MVHIGHRWTMDLERSWTTATHKVGKLEDNWVIILQFRFIGGFGDQQSSHRYCTICAADLISKLSTISVLHV